MEKVTNWNHMFALRGIVSSSKCREMASIWAIIWLQGEKGKTNMKERKKNWTRRKLKREENIKRKRRTNGTRHYSSVPTLVLDNYNRGIDCLFLYRRRHSLLASVKLENNSQKLNPPNFKCCFQTRLDLTLNSALKARYGIIACIHSALTWARLTWWMIQCALH